MDNKTITETLSARLDVSIDTINSLLDHFSQTMGTVATENIGVTIPGFGVFEPKFHQERISVHPATGKKLLIPPRVSLSFKSSPVLKQRINHGK